MKTISILNQKGGVDKSTHLEKRRSDIIPSCFQKLKYEFLKAYLVLCPVNQPFNI
jgi:hypothetical protein